MTNKKYRILSFLDYSEANNIYNEFVKYDQIELYACFLDTLKQNYTMKVNNTILKIDRHNYFGSMTLKPIPIKLMETIHSDYLITLFRIVSRFSDMYKISRTFEAVQKKSLEIIDYSYNYIISNQFDTVLFYDVPHLPFEYCMYIIAKEIGLSTRILCRIPFNIPNQNNKIPVIVTSQIDSNPFIQNDKENMNMPKGFDDINSNNGMIISAEIDSDSSVIVRSKFSWIFKSILDTSEHRYIYGTVLYSIIYRLRKVRNYIRNRKILNYYKRNNLQNPEINNLDFYYFPLHFQPEASTQSRTLVYYDQLYIIRIISALLPSGTKLCVKEHPAYFKKENIEDIRYLRNKKFYLSIRRLKNVILLPQHLKSSDLIIDSRGVITIAGSIIIEAYIAKKPALVFGQTNFKHLKNVTFVQSESDIEHFLNLNIEIQKNKQHELENNDIRDLLLGFDNLNYYDAFSNDKIKKIQVNRDIIHLFLQSLDKDF